MSTLPSSLAESALGVLAPGKDQGHGPDSLEGQFGTCGVVSRYKILLVWFSSS